jgi:hypothetical protein
MWGELSDEKSGLWVPVKYPVIPSDTFIRQNPLDSTFIPFI